jgi:hypothetical protein
MAVHIIVPTCGAQPLLKNMLASLAEHTEPCHLVLVVNHHEDWRHAAVVPQALCLRDNGWRVTIIDVGEKIGYTPACNLGWRVLEAETDDCVAVLNDDVVIQGRWAEPLVAALDAGAKLVGPSLTTVGSDGCWGGPNDPPYIEGWCLMVQLDFRRVSNPCYSLLWLFDPQYAPQLCEDMDLGLTVESLNPGTIRQVDIPIQHTRHATVDPATQPENARVWEENRRKLIDKWNLGGTATPGKHEQAVKLAEMHYADPAIKTIYECGPADSPPQTPSPLATQATQKNWQIVP